jgi:hypothetical protein
MVYAQTMGTALPETGSDEREEIEDLSREFADAGFDLQLSKEGASWVAALLRRETLVPAAAPYAMGATAVEATRSAWRLYLSAPSLNSLRPPPLSPAEMLAAWVEELAGQRRVADARNARALDSFASYLVSPRTLGDERARALERLVPSFTARTFPRPETRQLLLRHRSTRKDAQDALIVGLVLWETGTGS